MPVAAACHGGRKAKAVAALTEVGSANPQPITAAEAIRPGLVSKRDREDFSGR
jgi:hypothetical protein